VWERLFAGPKTALARMHLRERLSGRTTWEVMRLSASYVTSRAEYRIRESRSDLRRAVRDGVAEVGIGTYGRPRIHRFDAGETRLIVGRYCSIAANVAILLGGDHRTDSPSTFPFRLALDLPDRRVHGHVLSKGDIIIENDVWIGHGATILSGVRIGNGCVIAAGSVVTKDASPYTIVGGNPAGEIRRRCSPETAAIMEAIAWWNWSPELVKRRVSDLADIPLEEFVAKYTTIQSGSAPPHLS
jgi:acetyltransferase-like isoleucine patch superfamily enzyme